LALVGLIDNSDLTIGLSEDNSQTHQHPSCGLRYRVVDEIPCQGSQSRLPRD
jgi:hypothetical protein